MEVVSYGGCDICGEDHNTVSCPELGLNQFNVELNQLSTRARLTLPPFVEVVDNGSGLVGVVAKRAIKNKTQMGPYEAKRTTHIFDDFGFFTLKLISFDGSKVCLDTTDENECNWLCLVRAALTNSAQNCMAYQLGANIFYNTTRDIAAGEELQVWYAPNFARKLSKPTAPDGETRVLLGHRIEPLAPEMELETSGAAATDTAVFSDHEDADNTITQDSAELTRGEIRKAIYCPRCGNTFRTQTDFKLTLYQDSAELMRGEIRKAIYCPRCGNTFRTQTDMVQHLREHVMNAAYKDVPEGRRGRGRPRKYPAKPKVLKTGTKKRGRGRPRKSERPILSEDEDEDTDQRKGSSVKRKLEELDNSIDEDDDEDLEVKSLKIDNGSDSDKDFTYMKEVTTSTHRIQPSRSRKGRHSKYGDDFVVARLGKKIKVEVDVENTDKLVSNSSTAEAAEEENNSVAAVRPADIKKSSVKGTGKRGRGRPRKVIVQPVPDHEKTDSKITTGNTLDPDQIKAAVKALDKGADEIENKVATEVITDISDITEAGKEATEVITDISDITEADKEATEVITDISDITEADDPEQIKAAVKALDKGADGIENKEATEVTTDISDITEADMKLGETDNDEQNCNVDDADGEEGSQIQDPTENKEDLVEETENIAKDRTEDLVEDTEKIAKDRTEDLSEEIKNIAKDDDENDYSEIGAQDSFDDEAEMDTVAEEIEINSDISDIEMIDLNKDSNTNVAEGMAENGIKESKSTLVRILQERGEKLFCCMLCEERFGQEVEAIAHFMGHKNGWRTCKTCQKHFDSAEEFEKHAGECNAQESYTCDICSQSFKSAHYLYRHMVMHTDLFNCVKCKKTFSRKDSLQKHVLKCCPYLAESYKIFFCEVCNRVFSTLSGKLKHAGKCSSVKCEECKKVFSSAELHQKHDCKGLEMDENMVGRYSCGKCSRSFQSLYYLKQHEALHEKNHVCDKCGKNLITKEDLEEHQPLCGTMETIKSVGWGNCDKCDKVFNNQKLFRDHYLSHTHPYACGQCSRRFIKVGTLTSHSCGSDQGYKCPICKKKFKTEASLDRHNYQNGCMRYECSACAKKFHMKKDANHHKCEVSVDEKPAIILYLADLQEVCAVCGKSFSSRSNLTKHMVLHGEKTLLCPHCPKRFHLEVYLKEHITCVHYNVYKFQCTDCGKMLKSKTALLSHTRIFHQENIETYSCEKCGKTFKQKGNLRTHMYSHSNERNFKCDLCVRTFKYPDQLSKHRMEHSDVKKLSCDQCEKQFLRGYELKKHQQVFHSGNIYVCGVCSARCGHRHTLVRHYKRKHVEEYPLVLQEGYVNSLLKHTSELPPSPTGLVDINNEYMLLLQKDKKETASQIPENGISSPKSPSSPQLTKIFATAEALQSLALGNFTPKQFEALKDKSISIKDDSTLENPAFSLIEESNGIIMPKEVESLTPDILQQQSTVGESADNGNISLSSVNNALQMIQNADGTISVNGIHGMPQTIEGLEGMEGQIVILQIVDPDIQDGSGGEILRGEVIRQVHAQEVEAVVHQDTILTDHEEVEDKQVPSEIGIHLATEISEAVVDQATVIAECEAVEEKGVPSEISIRYVTQTAETVVDQQAVLAGHEAVEEKSVTPEISIQLERQTAVVQEQINNANQHVFTAVKLEESGQAVVVERNDADEADTDDGVKVPEGSEVDNNEVAAGSFDGDIGSPGLVVVTENTEVKSEEDNPLVIIESKPINIELEQGLSSNGTGTDGLQLVPEGQVGSQQVVEIEMVGDAGVQPVTVETVGVHPVTVETVGVQPVTIETQPVTVETVVEKSMEGLAEEEIDIVMENL